MSFQFDDIENSEFCNAEVSKINSVNSDLTEMLYALLRPLCVKETVLHEKQIDYKQYGIVNTKNGYDIVHLEIWNAKLKHLPIDHIYKFPIVLYVNPTNIGIWNKFVKFCNVFINFTDDVDIKIYNEFTNSDEMPEFEIPHIFSIVELTQSHGLAKAVYKAEKPLFNFGFIPCLTNYMDKCAEVVDVDFSNIVVDSAIIRNCPHIKAQARTLIPLLDKHKLKIRNLICNNRIHITDSSTYNCLFDIETENVVYKNKQNSFFFVEEKQNIHKVK